MHMRQSGHKFTVMDFETLKEVQASGRSPSHAQSPAEAGRENLDDVVSRAAAFRARYAEDALAMNARLGRSYLSQWMIAREIMTIHRDDCHVCAVTFADGTYVMPSDRRTFTVRVVSEPALSEEIEWEHLDISVSTVCPDAQDITEISRSQLSAQNLLSHEWFGAAADRELLGLCAELRALAVSTLTVQLPMPGAPVRCSPEDHPHAERARAIAANAGIGLITYSHGPIALTGRPAGVQISRLIVRAQRP